MAVTLAQIILDAKDKSDLLNNPVVQDPTWRRWINQGVERLYRLLCPLDPSRFHKSATFNLTGVGGNTVAQAADFRRMRGSGITKDPSNPAARRTLHRYNFEERDAQGQLPAWGMGRELAYDIQGKTIVVEPANLCAGAYAYYYVAGPVLWATDGSQDGTAIDVIYEPYVDFIATDAAIQGLIKDESDTVDARANLADIVAQIEAEFGSSGDPATIVDVENTGGGIWP